MFKNTQTTSKTEIKLYYICTLTVVNLKILPIFILNKV